MSIYRINNYSLFIKFPAFCCVCFIFLFTFLRYPNPVSAEVFINEIFANPSGPSSEKTEFIELYNTSETESVNLFGYKLVETKTYTIGDIVISPLGFVTFTRAESGLALNNSGDLIVLMDPDGPTLDSFSYDDTMEDLSWARFPDGFGAFYKGTEPSKNSPNPEPSLPTLIPTNILDPTSTPVSVQTISIIPTHIATIAPTDRLFPSVLENVDEFEKKTISDDRREYKHNSQEVLMEDDQIETQNEPFSFVPYLFILGGLFVFAAGVIMYYKREE